MWASALLVSTTMGNARRLKRGTSNRYSNPHFFYNVLETANNIKGLFRVACKIRVIMKILKNNWKTPIVAQWPLMVTYIMLIGWISVTKNPIPRWMLIFLHAYLAASIVTFLRSKFVKILIYLFVYILFGVEITLEELYGMKIMPNVLILMIETNARESKEFLESMVSKPSFWIIPFYLVIALTITISLEKNRQKICDYVIHKIPTKYIKACSIILLIGGCVFSYSYYKLFSCKEVNEVDEWYSHMSNPDDQLTKLILSIYDIKLGEDEMKKSILMAEHIKTYNQPNSHDSITIVLVIGESYIREHASIYGYPLNTTPFLSKEKNEGRLFVFNNMISPYNQTTGVIRNLISCNSIGDGEHWSSHPPFTAIYKKSGYYVSIMDNQKDFGFKALYSYSLNTYLYNPSMVKNCYNRVNDSTFEYDGQLIDYYNRVSTNKQRKQLVLFHIMGQHTEFEYRYPKEFSIFSVDSLSFRKDTWLTNEMREIIAHYDNATRYNDYVFEKISNLFCNDNSVIVYLSDHGEEVYDYRDNYGRDAWGMGNDLKQTIRWQYMVPFFVWCSDKYKAKNPDIVKQIEKATEHPGMLDNVCQILFHLSKLNTPYYNASRDMLSPKYHCPKRIINDKINSDSIINSK